MALLGLVNKKQRWGLSWKGWVLTICFLILMFILTVRNLVPFLASQNPVKSELLVVEGYIPDYALPEIVREFESGRYKLLIATGVWYPQGTYLAQFKTAPDVLRYSLIILGIDSTKIVSVPIPQFEFRDRTYHCGLAVKNYLDQHQLKFNSMNLYSVGVHGRRSRYLFQKAFDEEMTIGNIVSLELSYDPDRWWKTSMGFRTVTDEAIAWIYARFLFSP